MKITITIQLILVAILCSLQEDSPKTDIKSFLENIKQTIQKIRKLKDSKIRNTKTKSSIKRNLLQKLSSSICDPFYYKSSVKIWIVLMTLSSR